MTPEAQAGLEDYLKNHPHLEARKNELIDLFEQWDPTDLVPSINCRPGWIDLILSTHQALKMLKADYKLQCVKEKFGLLRIYTDHYTGFGFPERLYDPSSIAFDAVLIHSEYMSQSICENCGVTIRNAAVALRSFFGWVHTFCDACELEYADQRIASQQDKEYLKDTVEHWKVYRQSIVESIERYQKIIKDRDARNQL